MSDSCPLCNADIPAGTAKPITIYRRHVPRQVDVCEACAGPAPRPPEVKRATAATYPIAFLAGLVGASLSAALWASVAAYTEHETTYFAVAIGFLTGLGVRLGARGVRNMALRILSVALTFLGFGLGKYGTFAYFVAKGTDLGYLDPRILRTFGERFVGWISAFDALCLIIALVVAYRVAGKAELHTPDGIQL